jgi:predicted nucleic acid-binding protein
MKDTVILDTNILFRALRSRSESLRDILLSSTYRFVAPKYLIVELFKHKTRIVANTNVQEDEILIYLHEILRRIEFVDEEIISTGSYVEAFRLCREVDENDLPFVALALELDAKIWTNDEALKTGLTKKGFDRFFVPQF